MSVSTIIKKLKKEINGKNRKEFIKSLEEILSENVEELSNNEEFFNFSLNDIFSVISKVDFSLLEGNNKIIEIMQNIIKNIINKHLTEKETIVILQNLNLPTISSFSYEEIFSLLELITNCPILNTFCNLYKEQSILPEKDFEFEVRQKELELETLRQKNSPNLSDQPKERRILNKPKDYESDIFKACKYGKLTSVQFLIEKGNEEKSKRVGKDNIELKISKDDTPIHIASEFGHLPIVRYLIEKQKVDKDIKGNGGWTPLHYACWCNYIPIVEYLISKGANIEAKDSGDFTPLHFACERGNYPIVECLISNGANIGAKDKKGGTLCYACSNGHLPIVEYLISKGADTEAKLYWKNMTPLHYACKNGHLDIVEYLISNGANIEAKDKNEETPLHLACEKGHLPIVEYLISNGANIEAMDEDKKTPLHLASYFGKTKVVKYLVSKEANKNAQSYGGKTPYDLAKSDVIRNILK